MDEQARYRWIDAHILRYEREVRGWLRKHVRSLNSSDADDVLQEAYARVWATDFERIANGRSYLYTVVRNLLLEQARRARIVPMERMSEIDALRIVSDEPEPERRVSTRQEFERLQAIIAALPPQCRRAFELQTFGGLSLREIAKQMRVSQKAVEKQLAKALARIVEATARAEAGEGGDSAVAGTRRDGRAHEQD